MDVIMTELEIYYVHIINIQSSKQIKERKMYLVDSFHLCYVKFNNLILQNESSFC